jgi:hypothetical protein
MEPCPKTYNGLISPQFITSIAREIVVIVVVVAASCFASARLTLEMGTHSPNGFF